MEWADDQTLLTSGFDREAKRQWGAWDLRNLEQPLMQGPLHEGSGVPYFFFDQEYRVLLLAGRGDNTAGVYLFDKASPAILTQVQLHSFGTTTHKAFALAPKHCVDVRQQEVLRAVRVTNTSKLDVLALRIPSKVGAFNADYYPPFDANEPSSTAEAWCAGTDVPAKTMQVTAQKAAAKKKQSGLSRLKGGKPAATAGAAAEESKGGDDAAALRA